MSIHFGAALACFFATVLAMSALRPVAVVVDLVDKPGGRKTHHGEIPVVGGLAMFIGCVFGVGLLPPSQFVSASLLSAAALVVLVGLLDDRFEISPVARLTALGRPFNSSIVEFSQLGGSAFTCVAIVGAVNAFNMLDGMDGLAGTMAFNALLALTCLTSLTGDASVGSISIVLSGAVAAFLIFNIPAKFNRRFRCFMGDAGSTLLGFMLACLCISASQGVGPKLSPTTTLWIVAIPLYELRRSSPIARISITTCSMRVLACAALSSCSSASASRCRWRRSPSIISRFPTPFPSRFGCCRVLE